MIVTFVATAFLLIGAAQSGPTTSRAAEIHDHLQNASAYLKAKDPSSAARELNAVLAVDPANAEAYANLGVIAFLQHNYQNASQSLAKALAIDPSLVKTQALLGLCARRLGQPSAQQLLEKSFPKLQEKPLKIQVGIELANLYNQEGNLDETAAVMRSLVDLDPENIEILYMAQRVYTELADDTLNKLAIIAPASARMQQVIAQRLVNDGDLKGAIDHYRKALQLNPRLLGAHYELAQAILESAPTDPKTQSAAAKELQTAIDADGDSAGTESVLARIALKRSDQQGAYDHYTRALALDPGNGEAQLGLGRLLADMGKPEEAAKYLRLGIQANPLNGEAHYRLALVCKKLGLNDEAAKELRLFQEIKQTKKNVKDLYRQMNRRSEGREDEVPDTP